MDPWIIVWIAGIPPAIVLFALCGLYDWHEGRWKKREHIELLDWISGAVNSCFLALGWPGFVIAGLSALMLVPIYKIPDGLKWVRRKVNKRRSVRQSIKGV